MRLTSTSSSTTPLTGKRTSTRASCNASSMQGQAKRSRDFPSKYKDRNDNDKGARGDRADRDNKVHRPFKSRDKSAFSQRDRSQSRPRSFNRPDRSQSRGYSQRDDNAVKHRSYSVNVKDNARGGRGRGRGGGTTHGDRGSANRSQSRQPKEHFDTSHLPTTNPMLEREVRRQPLHQVRKGSP